jgi:glutamate/tyrosine decarboxylase-like PLP-dependent enzyme
MSALTGTTELDSAAHLRASGVDREWLEELSRRFREDASLRLDVAGSDSLATWFLGPKGENAEILARLAASALKAHVADRKDYQPSDPLWITDDIKGTPAYKQGVEHLEASLAELVSRLRGSVPFFSYRYQAHMLWDVTLPAVLGYLAAILFNQNNVAAEASPVTTALEIEVGRDLCGMLGYKVPPPDADGGSADAPVPWGHITCDGSVANIESMWASRNLKYYPVGLVAALQGDARLAPARELTTTLPDGGTARLIDLDTWGQLNLGADDVLAYPARIAQEYGIDSATLDDALGGYSLPALGFVEFSRRFLADAPSGVVVAPGTMHYSWPKGAALLGIGSTNLLPVAVDLDSRMDLDELRGTLDRCVEAKRPVIQVVAVVGSTEESAVDPLEEILKVRDEYGRSGMYFPVHVDAAWGGYFASILRPAPTDAALPDGEQRDVRRYTPAMTMSPYVERQYKALGRADSITVDPHKGGYIPYPAGGLCYRNADMRNLVSLKAPVVYHGGVDPTVGIYGVEGSKPGAAAAAVYLSHRVISTDQSGYGKILGKTLFNSKRLYAALVTLPRDDDPFVIEFIQRLPAVRAGEPEPAVRKQVERIRKEIVDRSNEEILEDKGAMALFRELGSDQNIVSYAFNFLVDGQRNQDVTLLNKLNGAIFTQLSLGQDPGHIPDTKMFVTSSSLDPAVYGERIVDDFRGRLGVTGSPGTPISFLISTTMDPWLTDTADGNFIPTLMQVMRAAVLEAIEQVQPPGGGGS